MSMGTGHEPGTTQTASWGWPAQAVTTTNDDRAEKKRQFCGNHTDRRTQLAFWEGSSPQMPSLALQTPYSSATRYRQQRAAVRRQDTRPRSAVTRGAYTRTTSTNSKLGHAISRSCTHAHTRGGGNERLLFQSECTTKQQLRTIMVNRSRRSYQNANPCCLTCSNVR